MILSDQYSVNISLFFKVFMVIDVFSQIITNFFFVTSHSLWKNTYTHSLKFADFSRNEYLLQKDDILNT